MSASAQASRLPTYFISHGGGPWPWIRDLMPGDWSHLERFLQAIPEQIGVTPRAVLDVASGLSYHNLRQLNPSGAEPSRRFDRWLTDTLVETAPSERSARLLEWDRAPGARQSHPREDHLIPLMVAVGAPGGTRAPASITRTT